jgi:transaldolase
VGVTTNPTIFAAALADGGDYADQIADLREAGASLETAVTELTCTDVQQACDVLAPVHRRTGGVDGRVSIEVPPGLARDTDATVEMAQTLWKRVDRPNLFVKIPATAEGLPAISACIAEGISINITLIFALQRYREVVDAYLGGLEQAARAGLDLSDIHSVASFFVSRVDTAVDALLPAGSPLRGRIAIANARLAYEAYTDIFATERATSLVARGANTQRPLWASTGVKDPAYPDTMYVTELVVANTVNTMPEKTLRAVADHGEIRGDTVIGRYEQARSDLAALAEAGVSYDSVVSQLEDEGLKKFDASWADLLGAVHTELAA